jgi:hypothetical protein
MDEYVLTKENLKELKALKLKQYQDSNLLSSEEEALIQKYERMKYSVRRHAVEVTPSQAKTPTSDCTTNDSSHQSQYVALVNENRQWRQSFASLKLSDYDKEMEKNLDHFNAAASHNADFLFFVRYLIFLLLMTDHLHFYLFLFIETARLFVVNRSVKRTHCV